MSVPLALAVTGTLVSGAVAAPSAPQATIAVVAEPEAVAQGTPVTKLDSGESLQYVVPDGATTTLTMQADGILVLAKDGATVWSKATGVPGAIFTVGDDMNFTIWDTTANTWAWQANTGDTGNPGTVELRDGALVVVRDGELVFNNGDGEFGEGYPKPAVVEKTKVPVPSAPAFDDPPNPAGVTDNVHWVDPLPESTDQIKWSESEKKRTATLADPATMEWSDGTSDPKVFELPLDDGKTEPPAPTDPPAADTSTPVTALDSGKSLDLAGGGKLVMQADGNLVAYDKDGKATFNTGTFVPGSRLSVQADGNVVVYDPSGRWLWQSGTSGKTGTQVVMDGGHLIVKDAKETLFDSAKNTGTKSSPQVAGLNSGAHIYSADGKQLLIMQGDGNLVLYSGGKPTWSSGTHGHPGARLVAQSDGNVVIYSGNKPLWNTGTHKHPGARLILQNDGNLVVYTADWKPLWHTKK